MARCLPRPTERKVATRCALVLFFLLDLRAIGDGGRARYILHRPVQ